MLNTSYMSLGKLNKINNKITIKNNKIYISHDASNNRTGNFITPLDFLKHPLGGTV